VNYEAVDRSSEIQFWHRLVGGAVAATAAVLEQVARQELSRQQNEQASAGSANVLERYF
jgi:hypothetical protein